MSEAEDLFALGRYKGTINRTYYAILYSVRAVIAFDGTDFKRHKTVMSHFNKEYVHKGLFPKEFGRFTGEIQKIREKSDYDDFFIASREDAQRQLEGARIFIEKVRSYLKEKNVDMN